jgi:glycosyltransferase involved in cell wall biosynthesis
MKVTLVNHSDTLGGASVVTYRLLEALCRQGVDVTLLVVKRAGNDERVALAGSEFSRRAAFYAEELCNLAGCRSRENLFKVDTATFGLPLSKHPAVKGADVVVLNWVNQGMMSLEDIARIEAPVVWTMHDMWPVTGVCHHAGECNGYKHKCGNCPLVTLAHSKDVSHLTWRRKRKLYTRKPITFIPVSNWLAQCCRESSLLREVPEVIFNAFPVDSFSLTPSRSRRELGLPDEPTRFVVMGAARLDNEIKGLPIAIEALNRFAESEAAKDCCALFYGDIRSMEPLQQLRLPYRYLGTIGDTATLASIYAHSTAVISTSHYENLPGTLIEGQASGCFPVAFDRGGQRDIIRSARLGYLATYPSAQSIADGLIHAFTTEIDREGLRRSVIEQFGADAIASRYIALFNRLLRKNPK